MACADFLEVISRNEWVWKALDGQRSLAGMVQCSYGKMYGHEASFMPRYGQKVTASTSYTFLWLVCVLYPCCERRLRNAAMIVLISSLSLHTFLSLYDAAMG